jgi:hypothetical protein
MVLKGQTPTTASKDEETRQDTALWGKDLILKHLFHEALSVELLLCALQPGLIQLDLKSRDLSPISLSQLFFCKLHHLR